jgi:hypothetical protein
MSEVTSGPLSADDVEAIGNALSSLPDGLGERLMRVWFVLQN